MSDFKLVPLNTLYVVQYRYISGNRRWKKFAQTVVAERAKSHLATMMKHADAPVEGRIVAKKVK